MSEQHERQYPQGWQITGFNPSEHLSDLKGREYLNVQNRLLWFVAEQRAMIVSGLAQMPYVVRTELVELDREKGFAHFKTYVRDVLGNEATAYGSETAKDFGDYAEKAGTKSLGRALLALGYGTAGAQELDEGERVVDAPLERKRQPQQPVPQQRRTDGATPPRPAAPPEQTETGGPMNNETPADDFDALDNQDLAHYAGIIGNDYKREFHRVCGIKPASAYSDEDAAKWRAHLLKRAREKAAIENAHSSLRELPVGERGAGA